MTVVAVVLWGVQFGGAATQLQTAIGDAASESADVANAMLTTVFNLAIFGGRPTALPLAMITLSAITLPTVAFGRKRAFPRILPIPR